MDWKFSLPVALKTRLRVDINVGDRDREIAHDARPHLAVLFIVVGTKSEAPDHLKEGEMSAVANLFNVVRSDAVLYVPVAGAIRVLKFRLEWLHARADEECGRVVLGDYVLIGSERETVLAEVPTNGLV